MKKKLLALMGLIMCLSLCVACDMPSLSESSGTNSEQSQPSSDTGSSVCVHTGGTATCTEKAECAICGEEYGELADHNYTELKYDADNHWYECICGDVKADSNEAHKEGTATCTEKAECAICGEEYGELADHNYTELKYDADNHWYECICGDVKADSNEAHKEGSVTCTEKAVCSVCNQPYGAEPEGHDYTIPNNDGNNRWLECACGEIDQESITAMTQIILSSNSVIMNENNTVTVTATADSEEAVAWAVADNTIATVENGVISGVAEGTTTVSVSCDGTVKTINVTVVSLDRATVWTSAAQIEALNGKDVSGNFILGCDIDLGGVRGTNAIDYYHDTVLSTFQGFKSFDGYLYGNGYAIKNYCSQAAAWAGSPQDHGHSTGKEDGVSFFGAVSATSVIENVEFLGFIVNSGDAKDGYNPNSNGTASLLSRNFAGTLRNVVVDAIIWGDDYRLIDGTNWGYDGIGFLFFSTEETAVIENVVVLPVVNSSRTDYLRVITDIGSFTHNGVVTINGGTRLPLGGTALNPTPIDAFVSQASAAADLRYLREACGLYPEAVFNFNNLDNNVLPTLYDGCGNADVLNILTFVPTSLTFDGNDGLVNVGKTVTYSAESNKGIVWTSSDENIATVENGVVTGITEGVVTITVTAGTKSASCQVVVLAVETATVLTSATQLEALNGQDVVGNFILGCDIDLGGKQGTDADNYYQDTVLSTFQGFKSFNGHFYGNGYAIKNYCSQALPWSGDPNDHGFSTGKEDGISFFGAVSATSVIENLECLGWAIKPGYYNMYNPSSNGTASLFSRNFAGTLRNVVIEAQQYGDNYRLFEDGVTWAQDGIGFLFFSTEATAVIENVVILPSLSADRLSYHRVITNNGTYTHNGVVDINGGTRLPLGGTSLSEGPIDAFVSTETAAADLRYLRSACGLFPDSVFNFDNLDNNVLPTLYDGCDIAKFID